MNIRKLKIFEGMSEEEIEKSLACAQSKVLDYRKNEYIFHQDDTPARLYFVLNGTVETGSVNALGKLIHVEFIKEGSGFGGKEVFLRLPRYSCYAKAETNTRLLAVTLNFFGGRCERNCVHHSKIVFNMLKIFAEKMEENHRKLELLTSGNLKQRILTYLVELSGGKGRVRLEMNREELATYLNTTRPSLSRMLVQLQEQSLIKITSRNIIEIPDFERLKEALDQGL